MKYIIFTTLFSYLKQQQQQQQQQHSNNNNTPNANKTSSKNNKTNHQEQVTFTMSVGSMYTKKDNIWYV